MRTILRRLKGALGISVTWGAAWAVIFAAIAFVIGLVDPDSIDPGEGPIPVAGIGAVFGFVSGAAFAALLFLGDRRKRVRDLSLLRAALWGLLATAIYPLLTPVDNGVVLIFGPIGAALAAASVAVAKRAELDASADQPKLPR